MSDFNTFEKLGESCEICVTKEHTFGTDAFLLADFAKARHKDIVCDLGTGCGIIAVLMRLRYEPKQVYGVDIQPQAIEQFELTVSRSGLKETYPLLMDLKALTNDAPLGRCDLVTCNPPYKAAKAGIESELSAHKIARHEILCNISDVCAAGNKLLKYGGRLCLCVPSVWRTLCAPCVTMISSRNICGLYQNRPVMLHGFSLLKEERAAAHLCRCFRSFISAEAGE